MIDIMSWTFFFHKTYSIYSHHKSTICAALFWTQQTCRLRPPGRMPTLRSGYALTISHVNPGRGVKSFYSGTSVLKNWSILQWHHVASPKILLLFMFLGICLHWGVWQKKHIKIMESFSALSSPVSSSSSPHNVTTVQSQRLKSKILKPRARHFEENHSSTMIDSLGTVPGRLAKFSYSSDVWDQLFCMSAAVIVLKLIVKKTSAVGKFDYHKQYFGLNGCSPFWPVQCE